MGPLSSNWFKCVTITVVWLVASVSAQDPPFVEHDDLAITYKQKVALDQFKERVMPLLSQDYQKEDIYLIRWLRANDFDLKKAEEHLRANLKWRQENKMDSIHQEDFSDIQEEFPVYVDTYDKKGQPVITATAGQWDIRSGFVTGRDKRIFRYVLKILDEAAMKVREAQKQGKMVTRFSYLLNLDGFNVVQHGCPRCLGHIFDILRTYEQYFPEQIDKIIIINAPPTIRVLFGPLVRSAVSGSTIDSVNFKMIGTNREEWRRFLLKYIDESQLTEELGGKRVRN